MSTSGFIPISFAVSVLSLLIIIAFSPRLTQDWIAFLISASLSVCWLPGTFFLGTHAYYEGFLPASAAFVLYLDLLPIASLLIAVYILVVILVLWQAVRVLLSIRGASKADIRPLWKTTPKQVLLALCVGALYTTCLIGLWNSRWPLPPWEQLLEQPSITAWRVWHFGTQGVAVAAVASVFGFVLVKATRSTSYKLGLIPVALWCFCAFVLLIQFELNRSKDSIGISVGQFLFNAPAFIASMVCLPVSTWWFGRRTERVST
jgi:hypothetical protein